MKTYIALLRGINVGGHKKILMAELREVLSNAGLKDVKTYIQSGNVIFKSSDCKMENLENKIQKAIHSHFSFDVPVLIKTREDLEEIFNHCPFNEDDKTQSYFVLLKNLPLQELVLTASQKAYPDESYEIVNDCIYFFSSKGYGNAKFNLNFFEKTLKTEATVRNYNSVLKLLSLSDN